MICGQPNPLFFVACTLCYSTTWPHPLTGPSLHQSYMDSTGPLFQECASHALVDNQVTYPQWMSHSRYNRYNHRQQPPQLPLGLAKTPGNIATTGTGIRTTKEMVGEHRLIDHPTPHRPPHTALRTTMTTGRIVGRKFRTALRTSFVPIQSEHSKPSMQLISVDPTPHHSSLLTVGLASLA